MPRRLLLLLAAISALALTSAASALAAAGAQNGVRAFTPAASTLVGLTTGQSSCSHLGSVADSARIVAGFCVATEDVGGTEAGTPIYRGVAEDHEFFPEAQQGIAHPGDPLGHADPFLHNEGFTETSRLTSWTTDPSVAQRFAGQNGVILRTTIEEMQSRGVNIISSPDAYGESEILLEGIIGGVG